MFTATQLVGFGAGGASPLVPTLLGIESSGANSTTHTYTNFNIGAAAADRLIIVAVARQLTNAGVPGQYTSVTIGGSSATLHASGATTHNPTAIAHRVVPTGTTATIVTVCSQNGYVNDIAVFSLTGYASSTPTTATDNTVTSNALSAGYTVNPRGILIAVGCSLASSTRTFTGLSGTKATDMTGGNANAFYSDVAGSGTLTCTFDSAPYGSMVLASWA
jgi:hypothetical protein